MVVIFSLVRLLPPVGDYFYDYENNFTRISVSEIRNNTDATSIKSEVIKNINEYTITTETELKGDVLRVITTHEYKLGDYDSKKECKNAGNHMEKKYHQPDLNKFAMYHCSKYWNPKW